MKTILYIRCYRSDPDPVKKYRIAHLFYSANSPFTRISGIRQMLFFTKIQGVDDAKTLGECKFSIGDYLDVAISPPNQRMDRLVSLFSPSLSIYLSPSLSPLKTT